MKPKEKAEELFNMMFEQIRFNAQPSTVRGVAKVCALIAVNEMIIQNGEFYLNGLGADYYKEKNAFLFDVKQELEELAPFTYTNL